MLLASYNELRESGPRLATLNRKYVCKSHFQMQQFRREKFRSTKQGVPIPFAGTSCGRCTDFPRYLKPGPSAL